MKPSQHHELVEIIDRQFAAAWSMLKEAIAIFPPEEWHTADIDYFIPARVTYHAVETVDYYCRNDLKGFTWGHRFGIDWESASGDQLPGQGPVLEYLEETQIHTSDWLRSLGDQALVSPDAAFRAEGYSHLDRALYVLRHIHQHLGELCSELRQRDLVRPSWR